MKIKQVKTFFFFALLLPVISATASLEETFESIDHECHIGSTNYVNKFSEAWSGVAHVEDFTQMSERTNTVVSVAGFPVASATHDKAITLLGDAFVKNESAEEEKHYVQVDYLQEVDEHVSYFRTESLRDVQIALVTANRCEDDENCVHLYLYCREKGESEPGLTLLDTVLPLKSWMRVNLLFDYTNQTCRVSVNGIPQMTNKGYLTSDCSNSADKGAWYRIATQERKTNVSSLQFRGIYTHFDDVKITAEDRSIYAPFPSSIETNINLVASGVNPAATPHWLNVSLNDLNRWAIDDVVDTATISLDKSGHTVKQKLELGYDPLDGKVFAPTNMAIQVDNSGKERVTLMIPKAKSDDDLRYRIRATGKKDDGTNFSQTFPTSKSTLDDATTATGELPQDAPRVLRFQLEAERVGE